MDVPLSDLGRRQALALGRWFGQMPPEQQPTIVLCSPYVRARQTAQYLLEGANLTPDAALLFEVTDAAATDNIVDMLAQALTLKPRVSTAMSTATFRCAVVIISSSVSS